MFTMDGEHMGNGENIDSCAHPPCFLCLTPTPGRCPSCGCSSCPVHLPLHQQGPQNACLPFKVTQKEGVGRCVVATRDIPALELILTDYPSMLGPYHTPQPHCLDCLDPCTLDNLCPLCALPLCQNEMCMGGSRHGPECSFFARLREQMEVDTSAPQTFYIITILRLLSVRDTDPASWARLGLLMDHNEEQQQGENWRSVQVNIVDWLLTKGGLGDKFTELEVQHVIGLMRTNGINIEKPVRGGSVVSAKAIYPTFSFLSHSCVSNARFFVMEDNKMMLRAQVDILEGQEITIQYITYLFGNSIRRKDIQDNWMFECTCSRCLSPSELGSHLSTLLCASCKGEVLPASPSLTQEVWRCGSCGLERDGEGVVQLVRECEERMMDIYEHEVDKYEELLRDYEKVLHQNHFQMLLIKKYLARAMVGNMPRSQLERKLGFMQEFINIFSIVDGGYTKWKGTLLYEVTKLRMFLADADMAKGTISREEFTEEIKEAVSSTEMVIRCLEFEPSGTEEAHVTNQAKITLQQAKDVLSLSSFFSKT